MSNMSDYLEQQLRAHVFRTASFTKPTVLAFALIYANKGKWTASTAYALNDYVMPNTTNGRIYKCTTAGTSAATEPTWPTTAGGTVTDGTAVWTEQTTALEAGTFPEVANAGAYARQSLNPLDANWTAPDGVGGVTANASAITYPAATADWGWIWGVAVMDSATYGAGNMYFHGALSTPKQILNSDQFKFDVSSLTFTLS